MEEINVHILGMQKVMAPVLVLFAAVMASAVFARGGPAWAQDMPAEGDPYGAMPLEADPHEHSPAVSMPGEIPLEQPTAVAVMGHDVLPKKGLFEVTTDLNVRAGPGTEFNRLEGLKAGDRLRVIGRTQDGDWLAVSKDGVTLGFVYAQLLVAVVDGTLAEQFFGSYANEEMAGGVACDYRFRFERKTDVEGGSFETADYEIKFRCASAQGAALFYGQMFLTEAPVDEAKGLHLIVLDVRSIGDGMEEFLSTSYLYHPKSGKMIFEGHTLPQYALPPKVQTFQASSVKDALKQALEASVASWTEEAWAKLFAKRE